MPRQGQGSSAIEVVRAYLAALAARDIPQARRYLAPEAEMVFPGSRRFSDPDEIAANSARRYRRVEKRIDGFELVPGADGDVVYCFGVLFGEWPDGTSFDGIRFIDRFRIRDGRICGQYVWNDMAETLIAGTARRGGRHRRGRS